MHAKDYFEQTHDAAVQMHRLSLEYDYLSSADGLKAIVYDKQPGAPNATDGTGQTIAVIVRRARIRKRIRELSRIVDEATDLLYGSDGRGGVAKALGSFAADIICAHYLQLKSWRSIAKELDCSHSWCIMVADETMEKVDEYGLAYFKQT